MARVLLMGHRIEPFVEQRFRDAGLEVTTVPEGASQTDVANLAQGVRAIFLCPNETDICVRKNLLQSAGPQLKIVATMSIGYDHIDVAACFERGIKVTNTPGLSEDSVAEFTIGLALMAGRRLQEAALASRRYKVDHVIRGNLMSRGLKKAIVGIVGMGKIGFAVMKLLLAFKVQKVLYFDTIHPKDEAESLGAVYTPFEELLRDSDYVFVHCNLTKDNVGLFNKRTFSLMKPSAVLINTSRGAIVDHGALHKALVNGEIRAAALDVTDPEPLPPDHPLNTLPNVVITPHIGSAEKAVNDAMAELAVKNVIEVLKGNLPLNPVN